MHPVLQQETPRLVGEPAMHLPDREPGRSGLLVPVELRHLTNVSPWSVPGTRKNDPRARAYRLLRRVCQLNGVTYVLVV
jgi:hypothetical protein